MIRLKLAVLTLLLGAAIIAVAYGGVQKVQNPRPKSQHPLIQGREDDGGPRDTSSGESYYFLIHGVGHVSVTDQFGNTNTPIVANDIDQPWLGDRIAEPVPGVTYDIAGGNTVQIFMSTSNEYTLRFRSSNKPFGMQLVRGIDKKTLTLAVRYLDLNLPAGLPMMLKVGPNGIEPLRYDADGDGNFESTVTPTANLSGAAAADSTAPRVTFNQSPSGDKVRVTITAEDSESGVKQIYYALNPQDVGRYTAPIEVDPATTPVVYAFADDNAANRSGLAAYHIKR